MTAPLRVVIMAGGTGGHVFPALSVAAELQKQNAEINWLGTARGIEADLVPKAGIPLHCLTIEGVRGKGALSILKAPWLLLKAITQAVRLLRVLDPQVVLGLGGFASGPGGIAAWLLRVPLVIHEQNAIAGTTNKLLSRFACHRLTAFPNSLLRSEHVGNPVRKEISDIALPEARINTEAAAPLKVLVLGGSLGALALNEAMPKVLGKISLYKRPQIKHQTGVRHLEVTRANYAKVGVAAEVLSFVEKMDEAYAWADIVICRAGALTISELTAAGCASVLVPYPYAIDDHQTENAKWLVSNGAAILLPQSEMTPEKLLEILNSMIADRSRLVTMAVNAKELALPNAAEAVMNICVEAAHA